VHAYASVLGGKGREEESTHTPERAGAERESARGTRDKRERARARAPPQTLKRSSHALSGGRFARAWRPRDQHVRQLLKTRAREEGTASVHKTRAK
jgi:hypothetical protein